jgi:periplasmic divalent cation tolerance protein
VRVVFCTCPAEAAKGLARQLVEEHLVACVNIVPGLTSIYRWEGKVCEDGESLLVIKTRAELMARLSARIVELHPYEVPEVIALPLAAGEGNPAYLDWLMEQTA